MKKSIRAASIQRDGSSIARNKVTGSSVPSAPVFPSTALFFTRQVFLPPFSLATGPLFAADSLQFRGLYRNSVRRYIPGRWGTLVTDRNSLRFHGGHVLVFNEPLRLPPSLVARRSLSTRRSGVYARRQSFLPPPPPPKPGGFMLTR